MPRAIAILLVVVAVVLIVSGRVYRRRRWGNWVAVAGYATLAVAGALVLLTRG